MGEQCNSSALTVKSLVRLFAIGELKPWMRHHPSRVAVAERERDCINIVGRVLTYSRL